jgi:hypothetical protein
MDEEAFLQQFPGGKGREINGTYTPREDYIFAVLATMQRVVLELSDRVGKLEVTQRLQSDQLRKLTGKASMEQRLSKGTQNNDR